MAEMMDGASKKFLKGIDSSRNTHCHFLFPAFTQASTVDYEVDLQTVYHQQEGISPVSIGHTYYAHCNPAAFSLHHFHLNERETWCG